METLFNFFDGFTWQQLVAGVLFIIFGFFPGFNLFQSIKVRLGWEGKKAQALVMSLSILITAAAMFVTGALNIESLQFNLMSILAFAGTLYGASQLAYQSFKDAIAPPFDPGDVGF